MIGAAVQLEAVGGFFPFEEEYRPHRSMNGLRSTVHPCDARPNVSGPPQRAEIAIDEEKETAGDVAGLPTTCEQFEPPQTATERQPAHDLPTRGEDTLFLTWWLLMSDDSPISDIVRDMTADLQYQDRQDMRQDVAMRAWQRSLNAELRGKRACINGQAIRRLIEQWLERNGKAPQAIDAQASPEDAQKAREALEIERAAKRREEWEREVMTIRAMESQKNPPKGIPLFNW